MTTTRMWRGQTTPAAADAHERFLLDELFPSVRELPGFLGAHVLGRSDDHEVAFVTLKRFGSIDDVRAFAGDPVDEPVVESEAAARLLARFGERATHHETRSFDP